MKLIVTRHPFIRYCSKLLGLSESRYEINGNAFIAKGGNSGTVIRWNELAKPMKLRQGFFFSAIACRSAGGHFILNWLSHRQAQQAYSLALRYWYSTHAQRCRALGLELNHSRFVRSSDWTQLKALAIQERKRWPKRIDFSLLEGEPREALELVVNIAESGDAKLELLRERFVKKELLSYQVLFDSVESKPLTLKQRMACIIDNDNNLVLAGAGTGKTSTMIGRTAYLIASQRAKPDEILLLAFGNKAAEEMRERIQDKVPGADVMASTFHSIGMHIIASVEGAMPSITHLASDAQAFKKWVDSEFKRRMCNDSFKNMVLEYFKYYLYPEANPFDFKSEGEYFDYIKANEIRTLKGEKVKSYEECIIANWLYRAGINYEYEKAYEISTKSLDYRQYKPDFYLPDYGIYLEHLGIDRDGATAPYVNREKYHAEIQWKRQIHQKNGTRLVETFHYEQREGNLLHLLEEKLSKLHVTFRAIEQEQYLTKLQELGIIDEFSALLAEMLRHYKASNMNDANLQQSIALSKRQGMIKAALALLMPILSSYESYLKQQHEIDFNDMITKAISYVNDGLFLPIWRYILVDEFQDISAQRARLVRLLRDKSPGASLFCVGDDWQAIYRFAGSDLNFTTDFAAQFGPVTTTSLDKTFRFNNSISEVATLFVTQNPAQLNKQLMTHTQVEKPAVSLICAKQDDCFAIDSPLRLALNALAKRSKPGATVYLLARYKFKLPDAAGLRAINHHYPKLNISGLTFHASKGKEADFVIILGLEKGKQGFPSEIITHPLLDFLLPQLESYEHAEERRLFYVAMTRARHRAYLISDMTQASAFSRELLNGKYEIERSEFASAISQQEAQHVHCHACRTGSLLKRLGGYKPFYGCSNYPLCEHTETACPKCNGVMQHREQVRVCIRPGCNYWTPVCEVCGGDMVLRSGSYGTFWGCSRYRGHESPSCGFTKNNIEIAPVNNSV